MPILLIITTQLEAGLRPIGFLARTKTRTQPRPTNNGPIVYLTSTLLILQRPNARYFRQNGGSTSSSVGWFWSLFRWSLLVILTANFIFSRIFASSIHQKMSQSEIRYHISTNENRRIGHTSETRHPHPRSHQKQPHSEKLSRGINSFLERTALGR